MMKFRKITAIIHTLALEKAEMALMELGVPGMSVTKVHGFGDYRNFATRDTMTDCARIEIFVEKEKAAAVAKTIAKAAHSGMESDGVIAILPVENFIHIREFNEVSNDG